MEHLQNIIWRIYMQPYPEKIQAVRHAKAGDSSTFLGFVSYL